MDDGVKQNISDSLQEKSEEWRRFGEKCQTKKLDENLLFFNNSVTKRLFKR